LKSAMGASRCEANRRRLWSPGRALSIPKRCADGERTAEAIEAEARNVVRVRAVSRTLREDFADHGSVLEAATGPGRGDDDVCPYAMDVRFGSFASDQSRQRLPRMSTSPPKGDKTAEVSSGPLGADFVAEVSDYYARGLPRFVDTSSYYAAFGER